MSTHFWQHGKKWTVEDRPAPPDFKTLPPTVYALRASMAGLYLEEIPSFNLPTKLYGDVIKDSNRIIGTFHQRQSIPTGVLLSGEKGSGKTLLAKTICTSALSKNIPVIVVNFSANGEDFNTFLAQFNQPIVVLFDEFEKVYAKKEDQVGLLTLFDGVYAGHRLYLFTVNDSFGLNTHFFNRPGRFYYYMEFSGIEEKFIREYCADNLKDKKLIDNIVQMSLLYKAFNFDMLQAVVEESNRYNEPLVEIVKYLNVKPTFTDLYSFDIEARFKDYTLRAGEKVYPTSWRGNPLSNDLHLEVYVHGGEGTEDQPSVDIEPENLTKANVKQGIYHFSTKEASITLTKRDITQVTYRELLV